MTDDRPQVRGAEPGGPEHLVVGHVSKPHGTRGELFVWPLTDRPEVVFADGCELILGDAEGRVADGDLVTIEHTRPFKRGLLVKLAGHDDRNAVESYGGRYLLSSLDSLEPLEDGEVYYHQLLGLSVVTSEGVEVGTVREVYETAPSHLLEVKGATGKSHLIPFSEQIVRKVELEARRLVIKPPPGLLSI